MGDGLQLRPGHCLKFKAQQAAAVTAYLGTRAAEVCQRVRRLDDWIELEGEVALVTGGASA